MGEIQLLNSQAELGAQGLGALGIQLGRVHLGAQLHQRARHAGTDLAQALDDHAPLAPALRAVEVAQGRNRGHRPSPGLARAESPTR